MYDKGKVDKLLGLVHEMAKERNIELPPSDPNPEQQPVYERYLRSIGRKPDDIDRVIEIERIPQEQRGMIYGMLLTSLMNAKNQSDSELKQLLFLITTLFSEQRATGFLRTIAAPVVAVAKRKTPALNEAFCLGVSPLKWFNGQSLIFERTPLCLVQSGCFSLIEIFVTLFQASQKDVGYAVSGTWRAIEDYIRTGEVKPAEYGLGQGLVNFGDSLIGVLTTSAEQFVVAHEIGHVALGHTVTALRGLVPIETNRAAPTAMATSRDKMEIIQPSHFDEHCADIWGVSSQLEAAASASDEAAVPIACAGSTIFMGLSMLVEFAYRLHGEQLDDTHPSASDRLYLIELALELTGNHENAYVAHRFREFTEQVGRRHPNFEMPSLLSRALNKMAQSVFEHLGFDLSKATYITEFQ